MRSHLTAVLATVFVRAALSPAVAAPAAPDEIVFDLAPLPITTVLQEVLFASVQPGLVVDARIEAVFVSRETDPWLVSVGLALPTGGEQFVLDPAGTSGLGRFGVDFHTHAFDGLLVPPDGAGFYTGFASISAAAVPSGGVLEPMNGAFTKLRLTLFLAPCPSDTAAVTVPPDPGPGVSIRRAGALRAPARDESTHRSRGRGERFGRGDRRHRRRNAAMARAS